MAERENDTIGSTLQAPHRLTRRSFIAGVGAMGALSVLGGLGLAGCSPQSEGASNGGSEGAAEGESYDVVIIGTGGAGMSAAIAAYDKGLTNVVLLEKMGVNGGNTNYSSSGMNASETKFQKEQGIEDSNDLFAKETLDGGHNTGDEQLVKFMCDNSAGAIDWLDSLGIKLDNDHADGRHVRQALPSSTDGSAVGPSPMVPGLRAASRRAQDSRHDELRGQGASSKTATP